MRIENTGSTASTGLGSSLSAATLGQDFMKLLITQLQNQDPMEPLKDRELVGQLTQLSSLDTLQRIEQSTTNSFLLGQLTEAAGLIGKNVTARRDGETFTGRISAVKVQSDGNVTLTAGDQQIYLGEITSVEI